MKNSTFTQISKSLERTNVMLETIHKQLIAADYLAREVATDHELDRLSIDSEDALKAYKKIRKLK